MPNRHRSVFLTCYETPERKQQRLATLKANKEYRSERAARRRGVSQEYLDNVNAMRSLGLAHNTLIKDIPQRLEGSLVKHLSERATEFLLDNFDVGQVEDKQGRRLLHFKTDKERKGEKMNFIKAVVEASQVQRKTVKQVYDGMLSVVRSELKKERRIRLPELGIVAVKYRAAKPKRKGRNPFNGEQMMFKAKPAMNKLRISPAKQLKDFAGKLQVVAPKVKKGKK